MCTHENPTRNDQCDYGVEGRAPKLLDGDTLLFDECGRCRPMLNETGSTDYHSHHFRVVGLRFGGFALLVRHGGGEERISLGYGHRRVADLVALMPDSDARYLFLHALYNMHRDAAHNARESEAHRWRAAAADKRIRSRRYPRRGTTKVWIEEGPRTFDVEAGAPEVV